MIELVRAQPHHAGELSAIARAAKAHWGYPAHWLEQWRKLLTITPEFIRQNETFVAQRDGQAAGFYALVETPDTFSLEHLWVLPERMGQGIGRALFQHAAGRAAARGASSLTIESDPQAEPFYLHLGARRIGTVRSEVDGQPRELPLLVLDCSRGR